MNPQLQSNLYILAGLFIFVCLLSGLAYLWDKHKAGRREIDPNNNNKKFDEL